MKRVRKNGNAIVIRRMEKLWYYGQYITQKIKLPVRDFECWSDDDQMEMNAMYLYKVWETFFEKFGILYF